MRNYLIAAVVAMGSVGTAHAANAPSITFTPGVYALPAYALPAATVFETFEGGVAGTQYNPATQSSGRQPESVTGNVRIFAGNVPNQGLTPDGDNNRFLAVDTGTFTVGLGSGVQFFSFVFGSLDNYNSVELFFSDTTSQVLTGLGIINGASANTPAGTPAGTSGQTGRVSYNANGGPGITSVRFGSSQAAFEIDDLASAAPEPGTWAMMIFGFGMAGSALRFRRRKTTVSFA